MLNIFIRDYEWAQSKLRQIDDETIIDLLRICEYQAHRSSVLDEIGIQDSADPADALYMYVLDALGVPSTGSKKILSGEVDRFTRECTFDREWFDELFYSKYLLENESFGYTLPDILRLIREEVQGNLNRHYK
jgi:hypothetical protein